MLGLIAFVVALAFTLCAALAIFLQRSLMRAVAALALAVTGSSVLMFGIGESLLALLQLLVFVGGLSTYLLVSIGYEERKPSGRAWFLLLAVIMAAMFVTEAYYVVGSVTIAPTNSTIQSYASFTFQNYYPILYVIAFALFMTAMGSVLVIKRFTKLIV